MDNSKMILSPALMTARSKLSHAAELFHTVHDGTNLGSYGLLRGFERKFLEPREFREQVFRAFGVRLTKEEVGAMVCLLDRNGDKTVDTSAFLYEVLNLAKKEKESNKIARNRLNIAIARRNEQRLKEGKALHVDVTWTSQDETSAVDKIRKAAFEYDRTKFSGLGGFLDTGCLTSHQLAELLRRNLNVTLTTRESCAIMSIFDVDSIGFIDSNEFVKYFFRLIRVERDKHFLRHCSKANDIRRKKNEFERSLSSQLVLSSPCKVSTPSVDDKELFIKKMRKIARSFEASTFPGLSHSHFEIPSQSPAEFKASLRKDFGINLTSGNY
jgi:Ca2+-binding EF-hand superfamily protein